MSSGQHYASEHLAEEGGGEKKEETPDGILCFWCPLPRYAHFVRRCSSL